MRSFIFRSTSILSRQVLPSLLILALVFAPFPPLLLPSGQPEQNAKEVYESTYGPNNPAPQVVARYTRGVSEPVITKDATESVASLVIDPNATPLPLVVEELEPEVPAKQATTRSAPVSAGAQANVAAALQVANGTSASEVVEVGLDASLNIAETVDSHGARTLAEYNEAGDPVKITAPDGRITYYAYDEDGNLTSMYSERSKVVARAGENPLAFLGRLITSSARALAGEDAGNSTALSYEEGAITEVESGKSTLSFEYDAEGNLAAQGTDAGESIVYAYDEEGNIAGKEVRTLDTTVATNSFTRLLARIGLTGLARSYARAYAGTETLAQSEAYGYDTSGELAAFSVSFGEEEAPKVEPVVEIPVDTITPLALPSEVPAAATTSEVVPTSELPTVPVPEATTTVDTIVSFLKSPFKLLAYAFAPFVPRALADVIEEVIIAAEAPATLMPATEKSIGVWNIRDVLGNIVETQNEKGEITSYRYDSRTDAPIGRTVYDPQGAVLIDVSYGFNSNTSRWTSRSEGSSTESYEYDPNGQLASVSGGNASTYRYDEHGNRMERTGTNGTATYSYVGNRLAQETSADGSTRSYTYDETGNVVSVTDSAKGTTRFSYETRGALSRVELPGGTNIRYTYDALNRKVGKSVAGQGGNENLTYRYEGANLTRVVNTDGATLRQYLYDPQNNLIAIVAGGTTYSVVLDSHGSVVALTDKDSRVAARFSYDAWGAPTSSLRTDLTDFYYTSGFYEPLVGMYLLGPRTYDPSIGRFLQKDPLAGSLMDVISQNEYLYAGNDPINRTDPTGHESVEANVGSSPRALAAQALAAAEEMSTVVEAARAQVIQLTADSAPAEQIATTEETYELAKSAQQEMMALAKDNEALVAELESAARAALMPEQVPLPIQATTTTEATTTPTVLPVDTATSTVPVIAVPATEASTTIPVPTVVAPAPEVAAPAVLDPIPVAVPAPESVVVPVAPVTFIGATGQVVLTALKDFAPHAFAKKGKSKPAPKKSPPPPPKKSMVKAPPPPPKKVPVQAKVAVVANNLAKFSNAVAKVTTVVASLNKTIAKKSVAPPQVVAKRVAVPWTATKKPIVLPKIAKVAQATKAQITRLLVKPAVPSTKKNPVTKLVSAPKGAKIQKIGVALAPSISRQMGVIATGIKATQDKQAANRALARARAAQLVADGKAKILPVVNSQVVKNAQYGLAACSFSPEIIGGTCGLVDGLLYGLQGNGTSAGLSFVGAIPVAGLGFDAAKAARLAEEGAKSAKLLLASKFTADTQKLQSVFTQHGDAFGVVGSWNPAQGEKFKAILTQHINAANTKIISGSYRGEPAIHFVDMNTSLDVFLKPTGELISGWKLSTDQIQNLLRNGNVQ